MTELQRAKLPTIEGSIAAPHNAKCRMGYGDVAGKAHDFRTEPASIAEEDEEEEEEAAVEGVEEEEEQEEEVGDEGLDDCAMGIAQENPKQVPNKEIGAASSEHTALGQCELPQQPAQRGGKRSRPSTAKERISKMPPCAAGKRSSIYRGVTRHRWTGRYEAHLWDKSTWNQNQNKKGKQVYLGAYDDEEAAARAYDLAALKYWGPGTLINFPVSDYARDIDEMQSLSREDYLASLRRKSSGFSRGASKMKGVSRNLPNARWDVQFGRNFSNTLPQLAGYDGAGGPSVEYGALGCPTALINLYHFMDWLQPPNLSGEAQLNHFKKVLITREEEHSSEEHVPQTSPTFGEEYSDGANEQEEKNAAKPWNYSEPYQLPSLGLANGERKVGVSALFALSQSSMFSKMEERLNAGKGQEAASTGVSASAGEALAAALAMDASVPSPLQEKEETLSCQVDHNSSYAGDNPDSYMNVNPAAPLPPLPFTIDHSAYLADPVPCLWNPFDVSLGMSMGMLQ